MKNDLVKYKKSRKVGNYSAVQKGSSFVKYFILILTFGLYNFQSFTISFLFDVFLVLCKHCSNLICVSTI